MTHFSLNTPLKSREPPLTEEAQQKYYSSWVHMAVHMALTIPKFQNFLTIAHQLGISEIAVKESIDFLKKYEIIYDEKGQYRFTTNRFHLAHDSYLISKHHMNWRLQAMRSLDQKTEESLHYSSVISISQEDYLKIRSDLLDAIDKAKITIRSSKEETLVSFCMDFFKISVD